MKRSEKLKIENPEKWILIPRNIKQGKHGVIKRWQPFRNGIGAMTKCVNRKSIIQETNGARKRKEPGNGFYQELNRAKKRFELQEIF